MKILNNKYKIIGQILFVIIFFATPVKSLDKFNKAERFSDYFSGILLLNENQYEGSLKYFEKLNGLESKHINYSIKYLYSLVNSGKFKEAFNYSRRLEKKNIESLIIEAGGMSASTNNDPYLNGKFIGDPDYETISYSRGRQFGGTGNFWGGNCNPIQEKGFNDWQ